MVGRSCHRAGWLYRATFLLYAANCAYPANAQSVSGSGQVSNGPITSPHWVVGGELIVGDTGAGTLLIEAGGTVLNDWAYIGSDNGAVGTLTVSGRDGAGAASTWTTVDDVSIGVAAGSRGTLEVLGGARAQSGWGTIGVAAGSVGSVTVSGPGSVWNIATVNSFQIGSGGSGTLWIDQGGAVYSGQGVIGWNPGSDGHVTVLGPATVWNPLNNIYVGLGGTGELDIRDGAAVATAGSSPPGAAASIYIGTSAGSAGTVTVSSATAVTSTLTSTDRIEIGSAGAGVLTVAKGGMVGVASDAWIAITGTSSGTLNLTGDASGRGVLETGSVIKGAGNATFNLDGGVLRANRDEANFLNGFSTQAVGSGGAWFDTNAHDVGVVTAFSGTSSFNKLGAGTLTLSGNSAAFTGNTDIQAGTLQVDGVLGVPVYEAYANTLLHLSRLSTLRQRVGNRLYDPADVGRNGVWSRVEGSASQLDPSASTTGERQDVDSWKVQFGVDRILAGGQEGSRLVGGLALQYGKADTRVSSIYGNGTVDATAYGLTPTLTWYGRDGAYVDAQAQAIWFDSDLSSRLAGKLKDGRKAHGYGLGIEAGKAFGLREGLALIPQAQLSYASTRFDSFDDRFGARVEDDKGDSLQGRLGIALDYKSSWQAGGANRESSVFGIVNVKHEFLDGTRVRVAGVPVSSRMARTWGSVGVGADYGWGERYAIYGQVDADADFAGSYIVTATAGFRMMF